MKILVISVHPDDETLGCGATILKHRSEGDEVHWLIVTSMFEPRWSAEVIKRRREEISEVSAAYGMAGVHELNCPSTELHNFSENVLIEKISGVLADVRPEAVYCVHGGDVHSDHRKAFEAVQAAAKPFRQVESGIRRLLCYETISSTDSVISPAAPFVPNVFNDVSERLEKKLEIMGMYRSEVQPEPLPRAPESIRALARYRGSIIGVKYAEAFMMVYEVIP